MGIVRVWGPTGAAPLSILTAAVRGHRNMGRQRHAGVGGSWQKPCSDLAPVSLQEGSQQSKDLTILLPSSLWELLIGDAFRKSGITETLLV